MEEQLSKSSSVDETKKLADLLLKIDGGKPSSKLISLLFDMMVSPASPNQKTTIQYIKNKEALVLIVTLFPRCSISLQLEILNKITRLAEQSQRNLETCRSSNLLNTCIELLFRVENDTLFDKLLKLTEVMARHSFSVTDMRNYFRLLRDTFEKKNMPHLEKLLRSFQSMCYKRGPAAVFDFDGEKSCGLSIPAFKMPAGGYSFCTWLRAEDFQDQMAPGVEPKIYSFLSAENVGVSCYFSRNNLTVAHHNGSNVTSHSFQEFIFQAKTWYFITLVHVPKLFGRSEIKLFVNGKQVGAASLAYPPANMMAKSCIGSDTASNQYSTQISFKGQLGSICLFSEQLTNERIAKLFDIGDDSEQIRSITSDSVVFIYYPRAFSKDIFFDVANNLHAVKLGSLQAILTETVKDALHCVGGLKTLFLLFHHAIDAPSRPTMSSSQKLLAQPTFTPLHSQLLALLLSLVASLLEGSPDNQQEMIKTSGMAVMSYVLESRWKDIIDVNCFTALENIVAAISNSPGNEKLRDEAYSHLFFNFKFWTSTSFMIQKQFLFMLLRTTMNLPLPSMKHLFGVQKFLDVLQTYYCFPDDSKTPIRDKLVSSQPSLGTSMLTVLNSNRAPLKDAELVELRSIVLNMMRHLVNQAIEDHEMQSVLALLQHPQTKARHLIDIENFLLYILYKPVNKALEAFNNANGLNVVLNLLNHDDDVVRLNSLKIITRYLELNEEKKRKKLLTQKINPWLLDTLSSRPFTITTYSVLCCITFTIPIESMAIEHSNSLRKLEVDGLQRVFCPEMLEVVFKLLRTASLEVKRVVLQDITILMSHSHEDNINLCSVLLNQFGWPEWFLALLAQVTQQVKSPIAMNTKDKDDALAIKDMLTNFFSTLLHYSFTHTRDGWRVLPDIETYLMSYKVALNTVNLMRNLYHNLIVSLTSDIKQLLQNTTKEGQQTLKNVFFENIAHLILFVEEFIFVHPKHEAIKLDDPKDRNKLDLNRHHLHIHMHRSKKHRGVLELSTESNTNDSEQSSHRSGSAKWKDFQLCKDLIELAELLMKDPYIDWLWTCDTTSYFGSKKHHVFHSILRQSLALLREAENHLDRAKICTKKTDLEQAEMLLLGINSQLIKIEENRSRLLQYITVLNNRETEEMKQVDQFFVKTMDRVKFIIAVTVKRNNNSFNNLKSQQQNIEVLLYALHQLFRVFKKSQKHGDSIHIVIFPALKDIIRQHLNPFLTNCLDEGLEETNPFISHRNAFELESSLQDFVTFVEDCEWKMPLQHKITKCKDGIDYGLLRSVRTVLKRREHKVLELQNSIDMNKNQQAEYLKRVQTENYALAHKLNYKETARRLRQLQNEHKRHLLTMKRWNRIWRELNTPRSVWKFDRESDEFVFWKLDKTEQNNRERRKLKRNYEGSHHTEASFTYLKLKWEKELEQERMEKEKKATTSTTTPDGGEAKIKTRPRRKSVAATPTANHVQKKRKKRSSAKRIEKEKEREIELLSSPRSKIDGEAEINALLAEADAEDFEIMDSQHEDEAQHANKSDREVIFSTTCELIYPEIAVPGRVEVTRSQILFTFDREAPTKFLQQTLQSPNSISEAAENPENFHFWTRKLFGKKRKDREWRLHHLTEIYSRRYLLNWTAIEMFFDNRRNFLLNFTNRQQCELFHKHVVAQKPKQLQQSFFGHARDLFKKNAYITELWRTRQISNFDYLMFLNKVAGRTYNDLTQYPVFPWIISNYETEKLDLNDPNNYRDLSKPVGALDEARLQKFQERYDNFIDDNIPPFYYGSHYSTAGAVLFYLIRVEPFTSQFLCLQGGKFDYPDRIFDSIPGTWENCLKSTTDVKELIPEFFYLPEFLVNNNQFDLGTKQNGNKIGNIGLPPWAKNEYEFIRIQREALESDYVSQHLHEWIDLIFGYKQRGEEAIKAKNTFYFLTYEGAIDLNSLRDPMQKQAVIDQIQNFGQTPAQLLIAPHPPRDPPSPNTMLYVSYIHTYVSLTALNSYSLAQPIPPSVFEGTLSMTLQLPFSTGYSLIAYKDSVIAVNRNGEYLMNKWTWKTPKELKAESSGDLRGLSGPQINLPFEIDLDHDYSTSSAISFTPLTNSQNDWKQKLKFIERIQNSITSGHENKRIPTVTMPSHDAPEHLSAAPFLLLDEDPYMVITYGYWDNSFKVTKIGEFDTSKMTRVLQSIVAHKRPVTVCDAAGSYLVTGSVDATLRVFKIDHRRREKREGFYVKDEYEHVLYGHYDPITAVKLHSDLDIAVSSSSRGVCLVHTLTKGRLIRALSLPADRDSTIDLIQISREGLIVLYSSACRTLWLFSLNGQLLAQRSQDEDIDVTEHGRYVISTMLLTKNGKFLITAGDKHVTVWSMNDLSIVHRYDPVSENVVAINFAHDERALLVALQNGQLTIIYKPNIGSQLIPGNV